MQALPASFWPPLRRFCSAPFFRGDGSLALTPGYDRASGLYYIEQPGLVISSVSLHPSPSEISEAADFLANDMLRDFCFVDRADLTNAIAIMVTPFVQPFYRGHTPAGAISKPVERAGAGLLLDTLLWPSLGRRLPRTSLPERAEEVRKSLFAFAREGNPALLFDNVNGPLDQSPLAAFLTSDRLKDRILGLSATGTADHLPRLYFTGIGITLSGEMTGRICLVGLDPKVEHPEERTGFLNDDQRAFLAASRGRAIWAIATLVRATIAAGWPRPAARPILGDFQGWADALASILSIAGLEGFMENRDRLRAMDPVGQATRTLIRRWWAKYGTTPVRAGMLWVLTGWKREDRGMSASMGDAEPDVPLPLGLKDGSEKSQQTQFGLLVAKLQSRVIEGFRVEYAGEDHNANRYQLVPTSQSPRGSDPPGGNLGAGIADGD
jgi:hypothetical protein